MIALYIKTQQLSMWTCTLYRTTDLVGLWPVSDELSPHSSVLEQSWLFYLFQCGSSGFNGLLYVLHPTLHRSASGSGGAWLPFPPTLCSSAGCHSSHVTVSSQLWVLDKLQNALDLKFSSYVLISQSVPPCNAVDEPQNSHFCCLYLAFCCQCQCRCEQKIILLMSFDNYDVITCRHI